MNKREAKAWAHREAAALLEEAAGHADFYANLQDEDGVPLENEHGELTANGLRMEAACGELITWLWAKGEGEVWIGGGR